MLYILVVRSELRTCDVARRPRCLPTYVYLKKREKKYYSTSNVLHLKNGAHVTLAFRTIHPSLKLQIVLEYIKLFICEDNIFLLNYSFYPLLKTRILIFPGQIWLIYLPVFFISKIWRPTKFNVDWNNGSKVKLEQTNIQSRITLVVPRSLHLLNQSRINYVSNLS